MQSFQLSKIHFANRYQTRKGSSLEYFLKMSSLEQYSEDSSELITPRVREVDELGFPLLSPACSSIFNFELPPRAIQPLESSTSEVEEPFERSRIRDLSDYFYQGIVPTQEAIDRNHAAFIGFQKEEEQQLVKDREAYENEQLVLQIGNKTIIPDRPLQHETFPLMPDLVDHFSNPTIFVPRYTEGKTERERMLEEEQETVRKRIAAASIYEKLEEENWGWPRIPIIPKLTRGQRRLRLHVPKGKHKKDNATISAYQKRFNEQKKLLVMYSSEEEGLPGIRHPPANRRIRKKPEDWKYYDEADTTFS